MHELALANSIVSTVRREVERQKLPPVTAVIVRIGALSAVVPDALMFNYEVLIRGTPLERAKLVIEEVPVTARCRACRREFAVDTLVFACPNCHSGQIDVVAGEELDIAYIEVEDTG